jgi:twitching motility protein PilT
MAQLDKLINRLQQNQQVVLESGKPPMLKTESGVKSMLNQQLSTQQIIALLQEIAPVTARPTIGQRKPARFEYSVSGKTVLILYSAQGDEVAAQIAIPRYEEETANTGAAPPSEMPSVAPGTPKPAASGSEPEINILLRTMFQLGASDLHLTSNRKPMVRLHGELQELPDQPVFASERLQALLKAMMPPHNRSRFEDLHDTDFAHEVPELARFRVNVFLDRLGIGAVLRQIPLEVVTAEKLGLPKEILDLCLLSKGLVLVTGPTGSGKSTTLCALVDYINRHRRSHIITIEDPIEFVHPQKNCLINQREVHTHTSSFANAVRAALREDPDIILVGDLRDLDTLAIAIETAEHGHLVFGMLTTTTAVSTVGRIVDQFPADRQTQIRTMLASSLKGVICQTLCKKIGGGRVAAMEFLFVTNAISNLIREGKIHQIPSVMQTVKGQGMTLLNDALLKLVVERQVAPEVACGKASDKQGFFTLLKSKGITVDLTGLTE